MDRYTKLVRYLIFISLSTWTTAAYCIYLDLGIYFGGAKVGRTELAGGHGGTDVTTGDVLSISLGAVYNPMNKVDILVGGGIRNNTIKGKSGDVKWQSEFIESSANYNYHRLRTTAGLQYYLFPRLRGGGLDRDFDNAFAFFGAINYQISDYLHLGFRATHESYRDSTTHDKVSGNTYGINLVLLIRR
jgi:hypothetical protein